VHPFFGKAVVALSMTYDVYVQVSFQLSDTGGESRLRDIAACCGSAVMTFSV
jgi:hypothetical protein